MSVIAPNRLPSRLLFWAMTIILVVIVVLPLISILFEGVVTDDTHQFTLAYIGQVLTGVRYWTSFGDTIGICVATSLLALGVGVGLAWVFVRGNISGAEWLERLAIIPIFIPPFVGAFAWILMAAPRIGILNIAMRWLHLPQPFDIYNRAGMSWVMGIYLAPYVLLTVSAAMRNMDPALEEAAQVSGYSRLRTAFTITLPVIAPAILSSATLVFVIAIGLFGTPALLGWTKQIMMVTSRIYIEWQHVPPAYGVLAVLSFALMLLSAVVLFVQNRILRNKSFVTVTGKGFRPKAVELGPMRHVLATIVWLYLALTVLIPLVVVTASAFQSFTWSLVPTLHNVSALWALNEVTSTLYTGLEIAIIAATLTTIFGLVVVWISYRSRLRGAKFLEYIVLLPLSVPGMAFGVGVAFFWLRMPIDIYGTIWIIILAYVGRYAGYAVRTIAGSLVQLHPELEESARISGYGPLRTFFVVTFPLLKTNIGSTWLFLYSIFITELSMVSILYSGDSRTISIYTFQTWFSGNFSLAASLSLLQLIVGMAVMVVVQMLGRRSRALSH